MQWMKRVFDAISPYDRRPPARDVAPLPPQPDARAPTRGVAMDGNLRLGFSARSGETRLVDLHQKAPLRAFFPRGADDGEAAPVLANVAGGLVGGDSLSVKIRASDGARALVTTQAAEKAYRSAAAAVSVDCALDASSGAALAWMPQPTILFDGANLARRTHLAFEPGASIHAGEVVVYGRAGSGERLGAGRLFDRWEVRRAGRLIWVDSMLIHDWLAVRDQPSCLSGAAASALFVHAGDDAPERLDRARAIIGDDLGDLWAGATALDGLLIVRWLGRDTAALVDAYAEFWRYYRAAGDAPGRIPRIWAV